MRARYGSTFSFSPKTRGQFFVLVVLFIFSVFQGCFSFINGYFPFTFMSSHLFFNQSSAGNFYIEVLTLIYLNHTYNRFILITT
ncbi:hypothetical protein MsAg5_01820 [Methanosarcinaceae archaeon Ag5]|uniref:Uncharacterized protein n=1 Tax=Methanolapillus africanus TaxID=3028297 RepID=A0AAE4MGU1_9EURY|nr:hypothetical protein [Methanosarcinaceae archaeon Ag5]